MPKISIITINLNNLTGLRKTIKSVVSQTSHEFEYMIIDGGSTDGSIEVIKEFEDRITYWISEPDNGIYQAMNKGIRQARGEYCLFLNSGDWLVEDHVIESMLNALPDCDILLGNVRSTHPNSKIFTYKANPEVSFITFFRSTLFHTSAFIRRSLFEKYGLYDETLKIVSDWKWYLIVCGLNKANVAYADIDVSYFDSTGISNSNKETEKHEREVVLKQLVPAPILYDYEKFGFGIDQLERARKYPLFYKTFWFIERCLFRLEKWKAKTLDG